MPGTMINRKRSATATALAFAAAAVLGFSGSAQAAATEPTPVAATQQLDRLANKAVNADNRVNLNAKQRKALQRQVQRQSGRAYGEYLGPYVSVFNLSAYTEVHVQYTETFGLWRTWTHVYRRYGSTWYDFGWSVY